MRRLPLVVLISAIFATTAFAGGPEHDGHAAGHDHGDVSKVNRSINVGDGERAGDVETVNGSITIGDDALIESAETVNGSVRIGANGQAEDLSTVNGSISVGSKTVVADGIETVNGGIALGEDAASLGKIETVNGRIELGPRAQANAGIELVNGGVELKQAARVTGDIVVRKPGGMGWFNQKNKPPRVILGANSVVNGNLVFEHEVELYVHTSAKITGKQSGPLVGGKATTFSGDAPAI